MTIHEETCSLTFIPCGRPNHFVRIFEEVTEGGYFVEARYVTCGCPECDIQTSSLKTAHCHSCGQELKPVD